MINEYYGVSTPTDDFLAHYGVKGMKWGIRRALRSGNPEKLKKQYMKATKKLAKLSLKANNAVNEEKYHKWRSQAGKSAVGAGVGAAVGSTLGTYAGLRRLGLGPSDILETLKVPGVRHALGKQTALYGAAGALGGYLGKRLRAHVYKRRQNPEVRKQLLYERDAWRREMENAFKGTKYGGKQQKQFHKEISRLSETSNPKAYMHAQAAKANNEYQRSIKRKRR